MRKISMFFKNTIVKSVALTILPIIYTILYPSIFFRDEQSGLHINPNYLYPFLFLFVIHILLLIWYGRIENKEKDDSFLRAYQKIIFDNADKLYASLHRKHGHFDISDWDWIQERGDKLCETFYNFIDGIADAGHNFGVSLIFKKIQNGVQGYTMSSRCAKKAYYPSIYRAFIAEDDDKAKGTYYKTLLDENFIEPVILPNLEEIKKKFKNNADDYSQYIALPISCTGGKTIGLLQITVYKGSRLSSNVDVLDQLCRTYFSLGSTAMLLTAKIENALQELNEKHE